MKDNVENLSELAVEKKEPYISKTSIEGLLHIGRPRYGDQRGGFQENFRIPDIEARWEHEVKILQDQTSDSEESGVLRGIHAEPNQEKFIKPLIGHAVCIWVDLRADSPSFKNKVVYEFNYPDFKQQRSIIAIPRGVGNSFYVIEGPVVYDYAVTAIYNPSFNNAGVYWNDPELSIPWQDWGVKEPILSERDKNEIGTLSDYLKNYGSYFGK
jgi:dTDP-4-dehydrorhamnose 3,5-epimerase